MSQLIGLSLVIVGAVKIPRYSDPKKRSAAFHVLPTREGAHAGMSVRFLFTALGGRPLEGPPIDAVPLTA